jgi:hypothetical protein
VRRVQYRSFGVNPYDSTRSDSWPCLRLCNNQRNCSSTN